MHSYALSLKLQIRLRQINRAWEDAAGNSNNAA